MTAAALVALWLAMWLQLSTPHWAAWTVMSLALPTRGEVAAKGTWRAGGTILGLVAGTIGVAVFAQSPVAMALFLATWIALNAYVGGRLPGLASYGAALSGLTTGLVVILVAAAPLSIFSVAMARCADTTGHRLCLYRKRACRGAPGSAANAGIPTRRDTRPVTGVRKRRARVCI
jgi:uncharacterized membrane protein YccC